MPIIEHNNALLQAVKHSLELILDPVTKPNLIHESFLDVEKDPCEERHENNDVNNSNDDCGLWLPIVNALIKVNNDDAPELEADKGATQSVH